MVRSCKTLPRLLNNGWTLDPRKRNVKKLCFLVNHVETAMEIFAGVLLWTWHPIATLKFVLSFFQPQEAGELCEFDESMGNAMFVSHQWVTGRKFSQRWQPFYILILRIFYNTSAYAILRAQYMNQWPKDLQDSIYSCLSILWLQLF